MDLRSYFGSAVRQHREASGLSQEDLADKAGLDRTYVSGIERGVRNPTLRIIGQIAEALQIGPDRLMTTACEFAAAHGKRRAR